MAAQDMKDALKHPHPEFPFATIGDDTITAFTTLSEIFTTKFKNRRQTTYHRQRKKLRLTSGNTLNYSLS
jgi:hypothetical protein